MDEISAITGLTQSEQFIVVSYDISNPKRLRKVAKIMESFGVRVQFSVFEVKLDPNDVVKMKRRLDKVIKPDEDQVRFYKLCQNCQNGLEIMGVLAKSGWDDVIIV